MGLGDLVRNATNKATEIVRSEIEKQVDTIRNYPEKQAELKQLQAEQTKMQRLSLQISSGFHLVHANSTSTMFQRSDGTIFFNNNYNDKFLFIEYSWNGPMYETTLNSTTNTSGQEITNGKSGKIAAGAVIGSVAGSVGTAVGAAVGAGGKKKKNTTSHSNTNSIQRQMELFTPATLKFKDLETDTIVSIVIGCNTLIDSQIKCFQLHQEQSVQEISKDTTDALKGIKALKELLDMGAITQEEFDMKKQQLLNN
jgi:ABC-type xylose transport system, permease component